MVKYIKKHYYFLGFMAVFLLLTGMLAVKMNFNLVSVAASTVGWVVDGANIYVAVLDNYSSSSSSSISNSSSSSLPGSSSSAGSFSSSSSNITCSAGSIRACIETPPITGNANTLVFKGYGENNNNQPITVYRWRLDKGDIGSKLIGRKSEITVDTSILSPGLHTISLRVNIGQKNKKGRFPVSLWSDWVARSFTVESSTSSSSSSSSSLSPSSSSSSLPGSSSSAGSSSQSSNPSTFPAAPSNVKVVKNSSPFGYLITWQDNSNNETSFNIERKVGSGGGEGGVKDVWG